MMDANAIQVRIGELCHQFRLPTMGAQSVSRFTAAGHGDAWRPCWKCWSRRPRTAGSAASAGCAPHPGCPPARLGRPSSTTVCPWHCNSNWASWPTATLCRLRTASRLPAGKTWETFEHDRVPLALQQQLGELADGNFVERGVNVLAFGLPGTGKTHALCAVGHRLVESGRSVLFAPAYRLVQDLLAAKRDLSLPRQLRRLDNYDFLLLDDLGYLPQGAEESEVLFTLIAERYVGWDEKKRGWHDHIASTHVVRAPGRRKRPARPH